MVTVLIRPRTDGFDRIDLLGRSVWERTYARSATLKPKGVAWLGQAPDAEHSAVLDAERLSRRLRRLDGAVLILASELPCITTRTLRKLVQKASTGPAALVPSAGGAPVALATNARELRDVFSRNGSRSRVDIGALARRLGSSSIAPSSDDELIVVGSAAEWSRAVRVLRRRKIAELLRRGVFLEEPDSVLVDPDVVVGAGTLIHPWVRIEGQSRVGKDCVVGSFCHIVDSKLGAGTILLDHCYVRESRVGRKVSIGPFAHLRPESDVGDEARVGNFVELKKSRLGKGAKAPHLSYIGDATIGSKANIGAGTITCNYDGHKKHKSIVGDGAFIGSDVQLVAPVRVGKGAFVAAGSCIVEDVPAFALALARSRQIVKKNWAKRRDEPAKRGARSKTARR